jgi:type IV pilus assembly protein PilE
MSTRTFIPAMQKQRRAWRAAEHGFTLIELMIVIAIVGILASVALPSYAEYLVRGRLVGATTQLAALQLRMEQYYQDHRTYVGGPCADGVQVDSFSLSCTIPSDDAYTITASGHDSAAGFVYATDSNGHQLTLGLPASWGGAPNNGYPCWVTRRGMTC